MQHILSPSSREILQQLAWANVLVAFDYDGTLAPIVSDPAKAAMRRSTRDLLARVADRYPCAVISGRAQHDTEQWLDGIAVRAVVGNHGIEPTRSPEAFARIVRAWLPKLEAALGASPGVILEDKRLSLAIHYRASREKKKALATIQHAVTSLGAGRVIEGKLVVNLLPPGAPHKGMALERVRAQLGCDTALYVGDDRIDEDVFALDQPGLLTSVRVGKSSRSRASFYLATQREIDELLRVLLTARPAGAGMRQESLMHARPELSNEAEPTLPLGPVFAFMRLLWAIDHSLARNSNQMEAAVGVTGVQRLVLRLVGKLPGVSAGRLAHILHLDPSTLTPVLQRMVSRRLIARRSDARDRRRVVLGLTAKGRELDVLATWTVEAAVERALHGFGHADVTAAEAVIRAVADGLRQCEEQPRGGRNSDARPARKSASRLRL